MSICLSQRVDLFVLSCLLLTVESHRGQVLPPQNVSLRWINDFQPQLSWTPPLHSTENCEYEVSTETTEQDSTRTSTLKSSPWNKTIATGRGFLRITVKTICNESSVEVSPPELDSPYPELVRDLSCYVYAANRIKCDWLPASHALDVTFFYWLVKNDFTDSIYDPRTVPVIQECSQYHYTGSIRTGCDLAGGFNYMLYMSFKERHVNNTLAKNTFQKFLKVQPPPLSWNIAKTGRKYLISWTPPDIALRWVYILNYTECTETKTLDAKDGKTSIEFEAVPHCAYCMMIKAKLADGDESETPWSQKECFDADADPYALLYVAVTIALVLGGLTALFFVCCRNNKEKIFPKVPQPVDLISDISENNNKNTLLGLYVLTAEEETCKITLVEDPFINKLDF